MSKRVSVKGKGADLFFGDYTPAATHAPVPEPRERYISDDSQSAHTGTPVAMSPEVITQSPAQPRRTPRKQRARPPDHRASTLASTDSSLDTAPDTDVIEAIRKIVKHPGREVSFVRLSPPEKGNLADIVYTYKRQGIKTSENEINRIAVNYLIDDYHRHGERSILAQVITALRA